MARPKRPTAVITFRLPTEIAAKLEKQIKREKTKRAAFVETIFTEAFQKHLEKMKECVLEAASYRKASKKGSPISTDRNPLPLL